MEGFTLRVSAVPTLVAATYASGDLLGDKLVFDVSALRDKSAVFLQAVTLVDQAKQSVACDLILFDEDPSGTTFTDNAAFDIADADMAKVVGIVSIETFFALSDNSLGEAKNLALPLVLKAASGSVKLWGALVTRGAPVIAAATDLRVTLGLCG